MMRTLPFLLISLALLTPHLSGANSQILDDHAAVWGQQQDNDVQLYFARKKGDHWGEIIPLTRTGVHVTPTLVTRNDHSWIAWVEHRQRSGDVLHFSHIAGGKIVKSSVVSTEQSRVFAPSITSDDNGRVWLAWSAFDGKDEDIYATWSEDGVFGPIQRIHADNQVPDVLPIIRANDAMPIVHSERMDLHGNARRIVARYKDERWVELPTQEKGVGAQWSETAVRRRTYKRSRHDALPPSVDVFHGGVGYSADEGERRITGG